MSKKANSNLYIIVSRTNQMAQKIFERFMIKSGITQDIAELHTSNRNIHLKDGRIFIFVSEIEFYDNHYDSLCAIFMPDLEFEDKFLKED